jgi:hypothetical protein
LIDNARSGLQFAPAGTPRNLHGSISNGNFALKGNWLYGLPSEAFLVTKNNGTGAEFVPFALYGNPRNALLEYVPGQMLLAYASVFTRADDGFGSGAASPTMPASPPVYPR